VGLVPEVINQRQRLVTDLIFKAGNAAPFDPILPGETRVVPHGLHETLLGPVPPTIVFPGCNTPLQVIAADDTTVTIFNPTDFELEVFFRCERKHTIEESPSLLVDMLWGGECGGPPAGSAVLSFGISNIGAFGGGQTRYLQPWNDRGAASFFELAPIVVPRDGVLKSFFVRHSIGPGNSKPIKYTVRVNGVDTALTVTLAANFAGQVSDLVNTVPVVQGDRVTLSAFKQFHILNGFVFPHASMELV
jgi:hypothetical protein